MTYTKTSNYQLRKPDVGNDFDAWGGRLNDNFDDIDDLIYRNRRRTLDIHLPEALVSTDYQFFGNYEEVDNSVTLSAVPYSLNVGAHRIVFDVTSGTGTIEISGTSLHQNTLNESVSDTENVVVTSTGLHATKKTWTGTLDIVCSAGCDVNIYIYSGFSLDKSVKITKMILKGKCSQANNLLNLDFDLFTFTGNQVTITTEQIDIDENYGSGSLFYWHKELSIIKTILKQETEFILKLHTDFPASWKNIYLSLLWE